MAKHARFAFVAFVFKRSNRVKLGTLMFGFLVIFSVAGYFYPVDPYAPAFQAFQPPSLQNIFGTDALGRDVFAQTIRGSWYSLEIGLIAGIISTLIGILIGGLGGYFGKTVDEITSVLSNVIMTIPALALLIVISAFVKTRTEWLIILLISIFSWAWTARAVRAQVFSLKTREFVDIAKQAGLGRVRILVVEVLPNMLAYLVMTFAMQVGNAIITEASLSALGLGPSSILSLGIMLRWAITFQAATTGIWWWILPPGVMLTLYSLSLLLINDGLDETFNPRTRK